MGDYSSRRPFLRLPPGNFQSRDLSVRNYAEELTTSHFIVLTYLREQESNGKEDRNSTLSMHCSWTAHKNWIVDLMKIGSLVPFSAHLQAEFEQGGLQRDPTSNVCGLIWKHSATDRAVSMLLVGG